MKKTIFCFEYSLLRKWLTEQRHLKKLTQRDVGKLLDISHSWVGKVEQGERRLDVIEYVRLCKVLQVDPYDGLAVILQAMNSKTEDK